MPRTTRLLVLATGVALAVAPVLSQRQGLPRPPASPPGTGVVAGRVIDADSGAPVGGATVHVGLLGSGGQDVTTDAQGMFEVAHLAAGSLSIVTTVGGQQVRYQTPSPTLENEFAPGEHLENVTLRVPKVATINGLVRNADGSPAGTVTVMAYPRRITSGRRSFGDGIAGGTDANGVFALKVPPGRYVVGVPVVTTTIPTALATAYRDAQTSTGDAQRQLLKELNGTRVRIGGTGLMVGNFTISVTDGKVAQHLHGTAVDGSAIVVRPTFHPAATSLAAATAVDVRSGQELRGVDVQLQQSQGHIVSGKLVRPAGAAQNVGVRLIPAGSEDFWNDRAAECALTVTDATGSFTFFAVPEGKYTLRAFVEPSPGVPIGSLLEQWAQRPVSVGAGDLAVGAVTLRSPLRLSGRTVVSTSPRSSEPIRIALRASPLASLPTTPPGSVSYRPTGEFSLPIGFPGRYVLNWLSPDSSWMMQSVALGGNDITEQPFDLTDHDVDGVVVTIASGGASLGGMIHGQAGTVNVLLFPAEFQTWLDHGRPFRSARGAVASKAGAFSMSKLPAGSYLIAAFPDEDTADWPDSAFVQAAARVATRVTLGADEHKNLDLNVVKIPR